jgi:hypothetical protein
VIAAGGLTLVYEGLGDVQLDDAVLTNWEYVGGPVGPFTELRAPMGIGIGDPLSDVFAAFPDAYDLGNELQVYVAINDDPEHAAGFSFRFGHENETVTWIGVRECAFEDVEDVVDG